jgi:ParB/RepB/Spo0J family partition protein
MVSKQRAAVQAGGSGAVDGNAADPFLDAPLCPKGHTARDMAAALNRGRGSAGKSNGHGPTIAEAAAAARATRPPRSVACRHENLSPAIIAPSPFQPRKNFPEEEISSLAASILEHGLLQPILVRPLADGYELLDGERRLRACLKAGLTQIRAEVIEASDAQARAIVLVSALKRKDLNAIEEALAFAAILDAGDVPTQQALADRLGVSQPHIANRLRLLELPKDWRERIISGEMSATTARPILAVKDHPQILAAVAKQLHRSGKREAPPDPLTVDEVEDAVRSALRGQTRELDLNPWSSKVHQHVPALQPTDEQREKLKLIETTGYDGKPELRATNVKYFNELWKSHQAAWEEKQLAKLDKKGAAKKAAAKDPEKLSPAERKRLEAEERQRQKAHAEQFGKRLYGWKIDWLRYLISQRIQPGPILARLLVYFATSRTAFQTHGDFDKRSEALAKRLDEKGIHVSRRRDAWFEVLDVWSGLARAEDGQVDEVAAGWARRMFWIDDHREDGAACQWVAPRDVEAIAEHLELDLVEIWRADRAGPLTEAYWELHTKDQLVELGQELKVTVDPSKPKSVAVKSFMGPGRHIALPKEIIRVKRPR